MGPMEVAAEMPTDSSIPQDPESIADTPLDEGGRLAELHALGLLDGPADPQLDRLTEFTAALFRIPVALVSLLDEHRLWFASAHGTTRSEAPRERSFCATCIANDALMVVNNAANDQRFCDGALVAGEPHMRFYAGAPVRGPGNHAIGTLCVLDTLPRQLTHDQQEHLLRLAGLVEDRIWQRYEGQRTASTGPRAEEAGVLARLRESCEQWINPAGCGPSRRRFAALVLDLASATEPARERLVATLQPDELFMSPVEGTSRWRIGAIVACNDTDNFVDAVLQPRIDTLQQALFGDDDEPAMTVACAVYPDDARHADFLIQRLRNALATT